MLRYRRILPRDECVGDNGGSSVDLSVCPAETVVKDSPSKATGMALVVVSLAGTALAGGGSSSIGEGKGGGMLVPSVKEPNLKLRAGSSNRFVAAGLFAEFVFAPLVALDAMMTHWRVWLGLSRGANDS